MSITLSELITRVRQRSDQVDSQFVSDTEITTYLNDSLGELYDLLVLSYENYFVNTVTGVVSSGSDGYTLPEDFYKLVGIDEQNGNDWFSINQFNFLDRNYKNHNNLFYNRLSTLEYRVFDNKILFVPEASTNITIRLFYVPQMTKLEDSTDTVNNRIVESWVDYAVVDAAIKIMIKEESDPSALMTQKQALQSRIQSMAANRDESICGTITDVYSASPYYWRF